MVKSCDDQGRAGASEQRGRAFKPSPSRPVAGRGGRGRVTLAASSSALVVSGVSTSDGFRTPPDAKRLAMAAARPLTKDGGAEGGSGNAETVL